MIITESQTQNLLWVITQLIRCHKLHNNMFNSIYKVSPKWIKLCVFPSEDECMFALQVKVAGCLISSNLFSKSNVSFQNDNTGMVSSRRAFCFGLLNAVKTKDTKHRRFRHCRATISTCGLASYLVAACHFGGPMNLTSCTFWINTWNN